MYAGNSVYFPCMREIVYTLRMHSGKVCTWQSTHNFLHACMHKWYSVNNAFKYTPVFAEDHDTYTHTRVCVCDSYVTQSKSVTGHFN